MIDFLSLALGLAAGLVLGTAFFGGLWWTIQRAVASRRPALWFSGSLLVRTAIAVGGLYLVSGGAWERLLAALMGFVAARLLVTRMVRAGAPSATAGEADHAPQPR